MYNFLDFASKKYYEGKPVISDAEFDILASHFGYKTVGYTVTDGVEHFHRMYSLQKVFDLSDSPIPLKDCVVTPKLDGAAVSLLYVGGYLQLALTRGDGKIGRDITEKMELLAPFCFSDPNPGICQINGEVVVPSTIDNARNYAAGSLNLKDLDEFESRSKNMHFVAYEWVDSGFASYGHDMQVLHENNGFNVVTTFDATDFPTDGQVYRLDNNSEYKRLGYTSHHPRGAFALKTQKKGVVTTLRDVVWQVGKSGVVSPVAVLDPVAIDGANVSRATLHNIEYIEGLNLEIGCQVEVIRSGDIIPRIVARVG